MNEASVRESYQVEDIQCKSCAGTGRYDGECRWCKGTGKRPRRMDGYYIGFEPTGSFAIDKILGAVACAGKAYHHTDCWGDDTPDYDDHTGGTPEMWIQNAAITAKTTFEAAIAEARREGWNAAIEAAAEMLGDNHCLILLMHKEQSDD